MPRFTKEDITTHYDRERKPAVNVKVHDTLDDGYAMWEADNPGHDPRFTVKWIDANLDFDAQQDYFGFACQSGYETAEQDAQEIWGSHVRVYSEGRSGGWAVVDGIDQDISSWDAIAVAKWGRFARYARGTADYTMALMCDLIYINVFEQWTEEESELIGSEAFSPESMLIGVPASNGGE